MRAFLLWGFGACYCRTAGKPLQNQLRCNKMYWTSHVAWNWDAVMGKPETAAILDIVCTFVKTIRCFLLVSHITRSHGPCMREAETLLYHLLVCHARMTSCNYCFHLLSDPRIINHNSGFQTSWVHNRSMQHRTRPHPSEIFKRTAILAFKTSGQYNQNFIGRYDSFFITASLFTIIGLKEKDRKDTY